MAWICLAGYLLLSGIHLRASLRQDARGRALTKPWLLLLLLGFYLGLAREPNLFLCLALLFSWLGDVLLIPKGTGWFAAGGISFMFAHFCFIGAYAKPVSLHPAMIAAGVLGVLVYGGTSFFVMRSLWGMLPGMMRVPMFVYLLSNSAMNLFALWQMMSVGNAAAAAAYAGAVLFFLSDCCLFAVRCHRDRDKVPGGHFTVMLLYLSGVLLISTGMACM